MAKETRKKRQAASKALMLIARRRAKWLALQRGDSTISKQDLAAGKQFAESFYRALIKDGFWMQAVDDISKALNDFVKLAEPQGAPDQKVAKNARVIKIKVDPSKVAIIREGIIEVAKQHGKERARKIFIQEGVPIRAPGSRDFIAGWMAGAKPDPVSEFWALPVAKIQERIALIVEKSKNLGQTKPEPKETPVSGIEAPPRKPVYAPEDFMPTSDDMIGLTGAQTDIMGRSAFARRRPPGRQITKQRYEHVVARVAAKIAARSKRKPGPAEFAAAKKRIDARLKRFGVRVRGEHAMGVSDIMAASYIIGAAAQGSQAAQLAIMKSVEAAKEGHIRGKKAVKALAIAKRKRLQQQAATKPGVTKKPAAPKPQAPKRMAPRRKPRNAKEALRQKRLLRSFYGSPYPSHPAFKIHE